MCRRLAHVFGLLVKMKRTINLPTCLTHPDRMRTIFLSSKCCAECISKGLNVLAGQISCHLYLRFSLDSLEGKGRKLFVAECSLYQLQKGSMFLCQPIV